VDVATEQPNPLGHAHETESASGPPLVHIEPASVVRDPQHEGIVVLQEGHFRMRRTPVTHGIAKCLLGDAEERHGRVVGPDHVGVLRYEAHPYPMQAFHLETMSLERCSQPDMLQDTGVQVVG
jgi:hypothetical protein